MRYVSLYLNESSELKGSDRVAVTVWLWEKHFPLKSWFEINSKIAFYPNRESHLEMTVKVDGVAIGYIVFENMSEQSEFVLSLANIPCDPPKSQTPTRVPRPPEVKAPPLLISEQEVDDQQFNRIACLVVVFLAGIVVGTFLQLV